MSLFWYCFCGCGKWCDDSSMIGSSGDDVVLVSGMRSGEGERGSSEKWYWLSARW